jgi:tetratricopeptide (TPR) repeat protein
MPSARLIPFALAALTFIVFSPSLWNDFVEWDDHVNLVDNPFYRGLGWAHIRWMFTSALMGHYIPLTWLTFALDYTLWGMSAVGYHLTSTLLHAVNAALFYLVARRVLGRATAWPGPALAIGGVTAALVFALHPLRAESVAWVTERRDLLSGLFFLLTLLAYLRAADLPRGHALRRVLAAGAVASYALALLSKSIVMTLPLVLVLLDLYVLRRAPAAPDPSSSPWARAVANAKLPYVLLGVAGGITSYWAVASQGYLTTGDNSSWAARIGIAGFSAAFYLEKTLVPMALSPLYEMPAKVDPMEPRFLVRVGAVIVISAAALAAHQRWPAGLAVWAYYVITLGPVSGLVHSGHQLAHDRYSYLSCLGFSLLVGAATGGIASMAGVRSLLRRAVMAAAATWILALAGLTWYQVQTWRDTETLWRYAADADPACSICQHNLGVLLYRQKLFPLARERYERALALRPDRARVHGNLGLALQSMGHYDEALHHIGVALDRYPDDPGLLTNKALVYLGQGARSEALPYLERANHIDPDFVPALVTLGRALVEAGHCQAGIDHLERARRLKPGDPVVLAELERASLARDQSGGAFVAPGARLTR